MSRRGCVLSVCPERLLWLAAYPRSGVTFLRMILWQCLGVRTLSQYGERAGGWAAAHHAVLNPVCFPWTEAVIDDLIARQGVVPMKTHEPPFCEEPISTILVVRDGRRVCTSLCAFFRAYGPQSYSMEEIIAGKTRWGNWSEWNNAWLDAPATVVLRHERMAADVPGVAEALAKRLGVAVQSTEVQSFDELHEANPYFFRAGAVTGNGGMTESQEAMFWEYHGEAMARLGYGKDDE